MEIDDPTPRSSSFFGCMASPSWFPVHRRCSGSRFHQLSRQPSGRLQSWRCYIKKLLKEERNTCATKHLVVGYDATSYAMNFDDGCWDKGLDQCSGVDHQSMNVS